MPAQRGFFFNFFALLKSLAYVTDNNNVWRFLYVKLKIYDLWRASSRETTPFSYNRLTDINAIQHKLMVVFTDWFARACSVTCCVTCITGWSWQSGRKTGGYPCDAANFPPVKTAFGNGYLLYRRLGNVKSERQKKKR